MQLGSLFWLPLVVSAVAGLPAWLPALAAPATASSSGAEAEAADASGWLLRIQTAARERNYQGTMVFTAGDVVSSSRVGHFCVGDQSFERIEALDGQQQRAYRQNDLVHSFWPQSRVVTVERRDTLAQARVVPTVTPRLHAYYELRVLGIERVAGREAQVLFLKPRDEYRFAQRLWADKSTGLMLRADVVSAQGAVLESSAFSEIEIGARPQREALLAAMNRLDGYRLVRLASARTQLDAEGWVLGPVPPGFALLGCVRRNIGLPGADPPAGSPDVLQAVFSDGLTRVSVFVEPHDPARPRQALLTQLGATFTLMKPHARRWWITVMGDVPAGTLKQFAAALERRP